jgi:GR25 family glycosyltransferase involved in LPS biosynthesis
MLINNLNYSIVSINERAAENKDNTRNIMSGFQELYFECIDGNKVNSKEILDSLGITLKNWSWHSAPRGGELGLWLSNINLFNKMINENIENVLLLEDDTMLSDNFLNNFINIVEQLPEDYDFLSLVFPSSSKYLYKEDAEVGLEKVCSAKYNHFSTIAILWSNNGAKKMIDSLNTHGIKHPLDIHIYDFLLNNNLINGYSIKPDQEQIVFHDWNKYKSTIDLDNRRGKLDV